MALDFPVKGKLVFKDHFGNTGWTEIVYLVGFDDLKTAGDELHELAAKRIDMCPTHVTIDAVSVSQESDRLLGDVYYADAYPLTFTKDGAEQWPGGLLGFEPDFSWTAQHVRLNAGTDYHRSIFLSGIPDDMTLDRQGKIINPGWETKFNKWVTRITNGRYGIRAATKSQVDSPISAIKGVDVTGRVLTLDQAYTQPINTPIFVHGIKGHADPVGSVPISQIRPTGRFGIESINGAVVTLKRKPNTTDFIYESGGYVRPIVYKVFAITQAIQGEVRKKSRGRPFDLLRGRSRVRYRR